MTNIGQIILILPKIPPRFMILSDKRILEEIEKGNIIIEPFDRECLGTNSYDVHLGKYLATYKSRVLDAKVHNEIDGFEIPKDGYVLQPNTLYLGVTVEYTETHAHVPFLEGKSSTGRLGIDIHATAGKGDVGFCNTWTLEISCAQPVKIYAGMPIGQLIYFVVEGDIETLYNTKDNAKYNNKTTRPVESMMWKNKF
jgi:dCTP deaminase